MSRPREHGFTLVELTITVAILGIIMTAIATTFTVMARTMDQTQRRFTESSGAKFAGLYWDPDASSSEIVNPAGVRCGTTGVPLVTFRWTDDRSSQPQLATWATTTSGTTTSLVRSQCDANNLTAPVRTTTIAREVVAISTSARCDVGSGLTPCATDVKPSRVDLDVATVDGRTFSVDGTRKVS